MPVPWSFRLRIACGAHLLAATAMLCACGQPAPQDNLSDQAEEPVFNLPAVPRPQTLDRAGILGAVAEAASAQAAGADDTEDQRTLDGRQFEFRIRFGCRGPSTNLREQWLGWSFDSESGTLRLRAMPTLAPDDELVAELGGGKFETVEGFWIPRPWLLQPACPATVAVRPAPVEAGAEAPAEDDLEQAATDTERVAEPLPRWPRIGIAQFFSETDPRTGRRSMRPYEAVETIDPKRPIGSQGFNLVLSGRLKALPGKRVIACVAKGAESPPECVVSADFDRVWIEEPSNRNVIAEWGGG